MIEQERALLGKIAIGMSIAGVFLPVLIVVIATALLTAERYTLINHGAFFLCPACQLIAIVAGAFAWRSLFGKAACAMGTVLFAATLALM